MPAATLEHLLERYRSERDDAAAEELVRRTRGRLLRVAGRIVAPDRAEDCVQLAYLSLMREREGEFAPRVLPWLITATVRIAYASKAKELQQQRLARQLQHAPAADDAPARALETTETSLEVRRRVAELPALYRDAVLLHHLEGLGVREVGALLGISPEAAKKRIQRGRSLLRSRLDPRLLAPAMAPLWVLADAQAGLVRTGGIIVKKQALLVALLLLMALLGVVAIERIGAADAQAAAPVRIANGAAAVETREPGPLRSSHQGRVADADGGPIRGARVRGVESGGGVRTDSDGAFEFDGGETETLTVAADGFMASGPVRSNAGVPTRISLVRGSDLVGRVTNLAGAPIEGARVRWHGVHGGARIDREAVTGADGGYRFAGLPKHSQFWNSWIEAQADGYAPTELHGVRLERSSESATDLVLTRGATYEGVVRDSRSGEPIAGAAVTVEVGGRTADTHGFLSESADERRAVAGAVTGPDGRYRIEQAPARGFGDAVSKKAAEGHGYGNLSVRKQGYRARRSSLRVPNPGERATQDFELTPVVRVVGRVVDGKGVPVGDARIMVRRDGQLSGGVTSNAAGEFLFPLGAPHTYDLVVRAAKWCSSDAQFEQTIEVRAGIELDLGDVKLDLGGRPRVELRVRDEAGAPVRWARVSMCQDRFVNKSRGVFTDGDGCAVFEGARGRDKPIHLYVEARGFAPAALGPLDPFKAAAPLEVVLTAGRTLRGRILWRDGLPARGVIIYVTCAEISPDEGLGNGHVEQPALKGLPAMLLYGAVTTDGEGRFTVADLPAGRCHVYATVSMGEHKVGTSVRSISTETKDLRMQLPMAANFVDGALRGTVRDAGSGAGVPGAVVKLRRADRVVTARRPGPARFSMDEISAGTWTLEVRAPGFYPFVRKAFVLDDESVHEALDLRLNRRVIIDGRLRGVESFRDFQIKFVNENGRVSEQIRIGQHGRFETSDLGPGKWFPLIGKGPWDRYLPRDGGRFELTPGASSQSIDWELIRASSLSFLRDNNTPRAAPISIRITDSEGRVVYEINHGKLLAGIPLLSGSYRYLWSDEWGKGTGSVMMRAGSRSLIVLR